MNKKTKTIIIAVIAVVVVGGLYSGINRWRQQRIANQILRGVYGLNTGILGGLTGGGNIQEQIAKEMAKEEAQQKTDEAKEAAKTPKDRYDDAEEMPTFDANSKALVAETKEIVEKVFGKAKTTSVSTGIWGGEFVGSGAVEFIITRLTTGADLGALSTALTNKGLPIMYSGIDNKSAGVMAGNDNVAYTFGFEIGEQTVDVSVMKTNE